MGNIILIVAAAGLAYMAYRVYENYRAATGTVAQRLLASTKNSATVMWGYIVTAGGMLLAWSEAGASLLNAPEVHDWLVAHMKPEHVGIAISVIGAITVLARLRSLLASFKPSAE